MKPRIGITMGDPAGIGPEILLKALGNITIQKKINPVIIGNRNYLDRIKKKFSLPFSYLSVPLIDIQHPSKKKLCSLGQPSRIAGELSGRFIDRGVKMALAREIDALVTCPINKESFSLTKWGQKYRGHTEMIADLTGAKHFGLMLCYKHLRSIHVTSHIALRDVPKKITSESVFQIIKLAHDTLIRMGIDKPKIGVSGLNPHAGDAGIMGGEEIKVLRPAVLRGKKNGWHVTGPLSPDVVWPLVWQKKYDIGVAMYHDQGQIPIKFLSFKPPNIFGVNITAGIPIIRTSVAHGTAYDIVNRGMASEHSLYDAINMAVKMVRSQK